MPTPWRPGEGDTGSRGRGTPGRKPVCSRAHHQPFMQGQPAPEEIAAANTAGWRGAGEGPAAAEPLPSSQVSPHRCHRAPGKLYGRECLAGTPSAGARGHVGGDMDSFRGAVTHTHTHSVPFVGSWSTWAPSPSARHRRSSLLSSTPAQPTCGCPQCTAPAEPAVSVTGRGDAGDPRVGGSQLSRRCSQPPALRPGALLHLPRHHHQRGHLVRHRQHGRRPGI